MGQFKPVDKQTLYKSDRVAGVLHGLIVAGANFRWNKGYKTAYLRFTLKKGDTTLVDFIVSLLKPLEYKLTESSNGKELRIGVSIDKVLSENIQEIVDPQTKIQNLSQASCLKKY